jgi:rhodanese-related sulfurtransferase
MNSSPDTSPDTDVARTPDEVARLLKENPGARVLDVRTRESREKSSTIPGSELLDVNAELAAGNMDALLEQGLDKDTPLVVVCNTGGKCTRAAAFLSEHGFDAVSVYGGMKGWEAAGKPVDS